MAFLLVPGAGAADPPGLILTWREARRQQHRAAARRLAARALLARGLTVRKPN